jgi:hypothetical protein
VRKEPVALPGGATQGRSQAPSVKGAKAAKAQQSVIAKNTAPKAKK